MAVTNFELYWTLNKREDSHEIGTLHKIFWLDEYRLLVIEDPNEGHVLDLRTKTIVEVWNSVADPTEIKPNEKLGSTDIILPKEIRIAVNKWLRSSDLDADEIPSNIMIQKVPPKTLFTLIKQDKCECRSEIIKAWQAGWYSTFTHFRPGHAPTPEFWQITYFDKEVATFIAELQPTVFCTGNEMFIFVTLWDCATGIYHCDIIP